MRYLFTSYVYTKEFDNPHAWLKRINAYTGILDALAEQNEVISIEQIDYEGELTNHGVDYKFLRFFSDNNRFLKIKRRFFPNKLHKYIQKKTPDVVVVQGLHFPLQIIQLRLKLGWRVKIIVQNHAEKPFAGFKKISQQIADLCVDAYLFASHPMGMGWVANGNLASAKKIYEVMEVSSVFHPVDRQLAKQKTGIAGGKVFLWVGRLNANKDPLTVVRAFLKFAATNPEAVLYMIYHTEELLPMIKILLAEDPEFVKSIVLVGKIPHEDLLYWFNCADFILSGSHYEGSGAAVCEAMSCGCIPVVTDILSFRMITDNGNCGLLYEAGNEAALLDALHQTSKMNLAAKRQHTLNYFNNTLSFQAIAQKIHLIAASL